MKSLIQNLLRRYDEALKHKESIINNKEPYYYYVTVKTKIRNRFLGIVVNPSYEYNTERRFNQGAYDQALAVANATINHIGKEIEASLTSLLSSVQAINEELSAYSKYKVSSSTNNQLNYRIEQDKKQLQELNKRNSNLQSELSNTSEQSQYYNAEAERLQSQFEKDKNSYGNLRQEYQKLSEANLHVLESSDLQQRSFFLSELWLNKDVKENENAIKVLKSLGFDANALAHYAILKNNEELFDLALQYKATCSSYMVEGTTLLQKLIHNNNEKFIQKVLAQDTDVNVTILNAVDTDMLTIDKLLEYNDELTKQKFFGYTLLQIAIDVKNELLVRKILDIDSLSATVLTNGGESALKIAVRSGNDSIVNIVSSHVNLETEVEQLGPEVSSEIKAKISQQSDIGTVIKLFKGETNLLTQYSTKQAISDETDLLECTPKFNNDSGLEVLNIDFASISLQVPPVQSVTF